MGVKAIQEQDGKRVFVHLKYSPKRSTLQEKLDWLPVSYMRVNVDNEEEMKMFETAVRRFNFAFKDIEQAGEQDDETSQPSSSKLALPSTKRPRTDVNATLTISSDEDEDMAPPTKKFKRIIKDQPSSPEKEEEDNDVVIIGDPEPEPESFLESQIF